MKLQTTLLLAAFALTTSMTSSNVLKSVAFVVMSQRFRRNVDIAEKSEAALKAGLSAEGLEHPIILNLHRDLTNLGAWTIFPILADLEKIPQVYRSIRWFAFLPGLCHFPESVFKSLTQQGTRVSNSGSNAQ